MRSLQTFLHPVEKPRSVYAVCSRELIQACEELNWKHERSTPYTADAHGIAARAVRRVKEGTSSVLVWSGLQEIWRAEAMECESYLRNVKDSLADDQKPYERRFNSPFDDLIIPFWNRSHILP